MKKSDKKFVLDKTIIGMIHVEALPGTPRHRMSFTEILKKSLDEARTYAACGVEAIAIENMHDVPYLNRKAGPEVVSAMAIIAHEILVKTGLACGIQILAGANREALAVAALADLQFIRAEGFVFGHLADEGLMDSDAGEILRYRQQIGASHVAVFTDIKKKHSSHAISVDVSIGETAKAAEFFLSDGVIVTGTSTGAVADLAELEEVRKAVRIPVLVGSGVTTENVDKYLSRADALIVGSDFKVDGRWQNPLDPVRIESLVKRVGVLKVLPR